MCLRADDVHNSVFLEAIHGEAVNTLILISVDEVRFDDCVTIRSLVIVHFMNTLPLPN